MDPRKAIPSMFHRRLFLLAFVFVLLMFFLTSQMVKLSVVEGAEHRADAEAKLDRREFLPTFRGRILDRHGRVLAMDRASDDLAIPYDVINGTWARTQAYAASRKAVGRATWSSLGPQEREALIAERLPENRQRIEDLYQAICAVAGIDRVELQRRIDDINATVQASAAATWERQRLEEMEKYGISEAEFKPQPIAAQTQSHVVAPRLHDEQAFEFRRMAQDFPGMLEIKASRRREYPWLTANVPLNRVSLPNEVARDVVEVIEVQGVADHILGSVRDQVWATDVQRRPFINSKTGAIDLGGYNPAGDVVGSRGIEAVFEDILRGTRGEVRQRIDTNERIRTDALPGHDVQLSLDIALQARVQAILSHQFDLTVVHEWHHHRLPLGTRLNAAAVVMEVDTGEILAMVTTPTMAMGEQMSQAQKLASAYTVNRASEAMYPPGSIIKPLTLSAAVAEGVHSLDTEIACTGHYFESNTEAARCWIYRPVYGMRTHDPMRAAEALARSCNIFFYTLADHLGVQRLRTWFAAFGISHILDIGLTVRDPDGKVRFTGESAGELPTDSQVADWKAKRELKFNETIMGIGQGPITWTPLHAANAYATLARGGAIRDATLIVDDPRGPRPKRHDDLRLSPRLVSTAIEGLRQSVEEPFGTGYHITHTTEAHHSGDPAEIILNARGVTAWAKTGTAQAPPLRTQDVNGDGRITGDDGPGIEKLDHSWFVGLVGPKSAQPMYAIAVLVEYGGSGGRMSGPIANQIIRALQTEGYLPGDPNAPPPAAGHAMRDEPEDDGGDD